MPTPIIARRLIAPWLTEAEADSLRVISLSTAAKIRRTKGELAMMLDHDWVTMNAATGIAYWRHWCPNCEYSDKLYRPKAGVCHGDGEHYLTCLRITAIFQVDIERESLSVRHPFFAPLGPPPATIGDILDLQGKPIPPWKELT